MKYTLFVLLMCIATVICASDREIEFKDSNLQFGHKLSQTYSAADCILKKHADIGTGYATGQAPHDIIVTYFDPSYCSTPGYPFLINSLSFTMIPLTNNSWPVKMD